jgi:hypothetical protein
LHALECPQSSEGDDHKEKQMESIRKLPASGRLQLGPMASNLAQPPVFHSFGICAGINRPTRDENGIRNGMGHRFSPVFTGLVADARI